MVKSFKPNFIKKEKDGGKPKSSANFEPITKYMATDLITVTPETEILEVIKTFLEKDITGTPVLNDKKELVGIIDDKDCLRLLIDSVYHNQPIKNTLVKSYMTDVMKTIHVDANVVDAAKIFLETKFKRLLIVDDKGKLTGQVSRKDILKAIETIYVPKWD